MPDQTKHIISHYDAALYALRNDVVMMFKLTDRLLETALAALLNRDSELCKQAIIFVSRALKRIGDHATNIGGDSFWRDQAMDIST